MALPSRQRRIQPQVHAQGHDPVDLGLCTYLDLTMLVEAARAKIAAKKSDEAKAEAKRAEAGERKGV